MCIKRIKLESSAKQQTIGHVGNTRVSFYSWSIYSIGLQCKSQAQIPPIWRLSYMLHVFSMLIVLLISSVQVGPNVLLACPIGSLFLYCHPDCPAHLHSIWWASWTVWAAIKKCSLIKGQSSIAVYRGYCSFFLFCSCDLWRDVLHKIIGHNFALCGWMRVHYDYTLWWWSGVHYEPKIYFSHFVFKFLSQIFSEIMKSEKKKKRKTVLPI